MNQRKNLQLGLSWIGCVLLLFGLGWVVSVLRLSDVHAIIFQELTLALVFYLLNRYWVKISIHFKSDLSFRSQLITNTVTLVYILLLLTFVGQKLGQTPILKFCLYGIAAALVAFFEEYLFRGMILGGIVAQCRGKRSTAVIWAVLISSLIFSLTHMINLFHQSLAMTVTQVVGVFGLGLLLGAIYLRTRSLWWPILLHFCLDFSAFLRFGFRQGTDPTMTVGDAAIMAAVLLVIALFLLRPSKQERIMRNFT